MATKFYGISGRAVFHDRENKQCQVNDDICVFLLRLSRSHYTCSTVLFRQKTLNIIGQNPSSYLTCYIANLDSYVDKDFITHYKMIQYNTIQYCTGWVQILTHWGQVDGLVQERRNSSVC